MHVLLEILVTLVVGVVGIVGGGTALVARRLHRANRLVPGHASPAPTNWLWSWRRPAVLHRRLRSVCQLATNVAAGPAERAVRRPARRRGGRDMAPSPSPLARIAGELVDQALVLDRRLVAADRVRGSLRRPTLGAIDADVRRLEQSARRLVGLSAAWQEHLSLAAGPDPSLRIPDLEDRMDAVSAALDELGATGR